MPIVNKTKRTAAIYNRGREVVKVYDHGVLAWQKSTSIPGYLCFTALEAGQFTLTIPAAVTPTYLSYVEWSKDGRNWNHTDNTSEAVTIDVQVAQGDKVYWRGSGNCMTATTTTAGRQAIFSSTARFDVSGHLISLLTGDNLLEHLTNYNTDGVRNATFARLFEGCDTIVNASDLVLPTFTSWHTYIFQYMFYNSSLVSAPNLPSLDTAPYCYGYMFNLCTSLTQAPSSIAATTLRVQCCRSMFEGDTALVAAPSIAATTLDGGSELYRTFSGCTSLVTPPSDLRPTSINVASYYMTFNNCRSMTTMPTLHFTSIASDGINACLNMFSGCTNLTGEASIDVPSAPKSAFTGMFSSTKITRAYVRCPIAGDDSFRQTFFNIQTLSDIDIIGATSVGVNTYLSCFYGCRATRQNIVLPATTLAEGCYKQMFYSSGGTINKVTCLATDISATDCLTNWLANAAPTGTFIQAEGVEWPRGASGIPDNWTIETQTT